MSSRGDFVKEAGQPLQRSLVLQSYNGHNNYSSYTNTQIQFAQIHKYILNKYILDPPAPAIAVPILGIKANIGCRDQETTLSEISIVP